MRHILAAMLAGILAATTGCGRAVRTYEPWQSTPIESARPQALGSLPVEGTLTSGASLAVEFGVAGSWLDQGGTAEPALLYELSTFDGVHVLTLTVSNTRAAASGGGFGVGNVRPRVRLLDAGRTLTREFAPNRFAVLPTQELQATIFFNPPVRSERYVLITSDAVPPQNPNPAPPTVETRTFSSPARGVLLLDLRPVTVERVPFP